MESSDPQMAASITITIVTMYDWPLVRSEFGDRNETKGQILLCQIPLVEHLSAAS